MPVRQAQGAGDGGARRPRHRTSEFEGFLGFFASLTRTRAGMFLTVIGMMAFLYAVFFGSGVLKKDNFIYTAFCTRPIAYVCTSLFCISIALLLRKLHFTLLEWRAFDLEPDILPQDAGATIQRESADAIAAKIQMLPPHQRGLLLPQRLDRSLQRMRNTGSSTDMSSVLNDLSNIDRQTAESGYTFVRFLIAVIPIVGFIGTVIGISGSLSAFSGVISNTDSFEKCKEALRPVTKDLGLAFESTFIALIESAFIMFCMAIVQKREDDLLISLDDFCIQRILSRLRVGEGGGQGGGGEATARELSAINIALIERAHDVEGAVREIGQEICTWLKRIAADGKPPGASPPVKPPTRTMPAVRPADDPHGPTMHLPKGG